MIEPQAVPVGYSTAHDLVARLFAALHEGRRDLAIQACSVDAVWWLPVDGGDRLPVAVAFARLTALLHGVERVNPATVVVSPRADVVVVELVVRLPGRRTMTAMTSVVYVDGGQVVSGRTYLDIAAWPSRRTPASSHD